MLLNILIRYLQDPVCRVHAEIVLTKQNSNKIEDI